jgi:SNF2 family DNA or RNA helicase
MILYEHQKLALTYMRLYESFALFMEQGCGKTLPTLVRIADLLKSGAINNALIIAPKATMGAWFRDMDNLVADKLLLTQKVTVINYDMVWRPNKGYDHSWDCIILDESHKIKNRTSKRSEFILKLSLMAKYKYILTGTPINNGKLEDIWAQYTFLLPKPGKKRGKVDSVLLGTYYEFLDRYAILNKYYQPYKYVNISELQDIISEHSYRVTKEECLDLPEKLPDEIYDIELTTNKKYYKEMATTHVIAHLELIATNPLAHRTMLRELASGFLKRKSEGESLLEEYGCEKISVLEDFLDGYSKKLVIFCQFKYSIKQVSKLLMKLKISHYILDGDQPNKNIWRDFQKNSTQVMVCQYESGCAGIDLFAADTIIYYEPTISSNVLEQSRDRIHRIGQSQKCSYIHFITKGTVETAIYSALSSYKDFSEDLFNLYMEQFQKGVY